jgi:hypothetical protein
MAWLGFAGGLCLLLMTGSSVIKTLLIPQNLSSSINSVVARLVLACSRMLTWRVGSLHRRERILAAGAPMFLFTLLVSWILCLYVAFALMLLPFTRTDVPTAFRLSGSSLFTLGFATPAGAAPYGIVFAAAISGLGVIALMIGYMPTIYSAYNRRETLVIMLEALSGKPPWGPELLARQQLIGNVSYLPRLYERWTEWAADLLPVPVPGERVAAGAARRARRGRAAAVPVPVIRAFRGQAAAAGGICHDALPGAQPPGPVRRGPAPGRPARAHQGGLRAGGQAPGRGGVGVRPQAGRGLAALPRLAGELRAGRLQHRRAPGPGACPVVRPAGPARRRGADARAPSAQGA